ncbi:universal stress protein [Massilia sp. G4R7]|uniref:Universal stress protein n=1 Tax=Massilia phyllostachyos TaxID=2898585 RepID=A0ABS8Q3L9_9BURK|nr:universal stress protein [Massilia phyllostachyos]MCD2516189.1 universal stress protein [Massilia phyllostachyos]
MYRHILVPTDGSPVAIQAADAAIDFARACGSDIVALSVAVTEPVFQAFEGAVAWDPRLQAEQLLRQAQEYAGAVATRARTAGVPCTTVASCALDPVAAIADAAREHGCDLIVMGSHGRRGLSRLLAGSVTQGVLAYAPAPVMVLRPPLPQRETRPASQPAGGAA